MVKLVSGWLGLWVGGQLCGRVEGWLFDWCMDGGLGV